MAGGPILPSSVYLGGASGNLAPGVYIPATNTNNAGAIEGITVVASLGSDSAAVLQFNLPETIPTGVMKCRCLAWANATSGVAKLTLSDGQTAVGSNIGATTLTADTQVSQTWSSADVIVENKVTLATTPTANYVLTVLATFNTSGWTLAQNSVWQFSLVWE
jgi:hypothetical protein